MEGAKPTPAILRWLPSRICPACDRPLPFYAAACPFCGERLPRAVAGRFLLAAVAIAALAALFFLRVPSLERLWQSAQTPKGAFALALLAIAILAPAVPPMPGLPRRGRAAVSLAVRAALLLAAALVLCGGAAKMCR